MFPVSDNSGNVPAFLLKLWALVEDDSCDDLISWDATGKSFHVSDQARFAKEVLPHYFKHNNISSFIRQLNMYGFRKVGTVEQGALKVERDDVEFHHPFFQRGEESLLENIKRRTSNPKSESIKYLHDDVNDLLVDVHSIKGKQDTVSDKLDQLRNENEVLWREVASLRQKHAKQQQIVNKLIQFLVTLAGGNRGLSGMKRRMQLMIEEPGNQPANKMPKLSHSLSITENKTPYTVQSPSAITNETSGPVIHDVTDVYHNNNNTSSPLLDLTSENVTNIASSPQMFSVDNILSPVNTLYPVNQCDLFSTTTDMSACIDTTDFTPVTSEIPSDITSSSIISKAVCASTSTTACPKAEVNDQLENMQKDLEGLKDFLSGGQFNLDTNVLLGLFTPESPIPNIPDTLFDLSYPSASDNLPTGAGLTGNEVMQFNPNDGVPLNLFDFTDEDINEEDNNLLTLPVFQNDGLDTPVLKEDNPLSRISTEDLD